MTEAELEQSARIVEAELRKIREATGMRSIGATAEKRREYWQVCADCGTIANRDTLSDAMLAVEARRRKAAK